MYGVCYRDVILSNDTIVSQSGHAIGAQFLSVVRMGDTPVSSEVNSQNLAVEVPLSLVEANHIPASNDIEVALLSARASPRERSSVVTYLTHQGHDFFCGLLTVGVARRFEYFNDLPHNTVLFVVADLIFG